MKLVIVFFAFLLVFLGCERDLGFNTFEVISGYRIEGRATDRIGNPVRNVDVRVFYDYEYMDYNAPPTKEYDVPGSTPTVTVVVRNRAGQLIRTLFSGNPPAGPFVIDWDKKDVNGNDVPSSTYSVHYDVNNVSQKSYTVTVDGTIVTRTDTLGRYTVPGDNLPVGYYPVPIFSSSGSTFFGNHRITSLVRLSFVTPSRSRTVSVTLLKDRVTLVDVIIG